MTGDRVRLAGGGLREEPDPPAGGGYRMLGSLAEADDAVQEAWLPLSRSAASGVDNLGGWLTPIVVAGVSERAALS